MAANMNLNRRDFAKTTASIGAGLLISPKIAVGKTVATLKPASLLNGLIEEPTEAPFDNALWYTANKSGQGFLYRFEKGLLANGIYLVSDFLVDGDELVVFQLWLREGEDGPQFNLKYKGLNQAQARIRLPLSATDQNRWLLGREGAWLKPTCYGDRVDLSQIDRMIVKVTRKTDKPARWCQTPFRLVDEEPQHLAEPALPKGKLLDEMGQSTIHAWPGRTRGLPELKKRLATQSQQANKQKWPARFTQWGGWKENKLQDGTGYYTTHFDGDRWWLVDPDGHAFWSAGMDCVRSRIQAVYGGLEKALTWLPPKDGEYKECFDTYRTSFNYLGANFIRAFGSEKWYEEWAKISLSMLKRFGFNTVANWSEWKIAQKAQFPYVIPLSKRFERSKMIFRDFPDVFHPDFEKDAADYGKQLAWAKGDKALIGYFLMNEPKWGFAWESPAAGMLFNTPSCETRKELAAFLRKKYKTNDALAKAWNIQTTFDTIRESRWTQRLTEQAKKDLFAFSEIMVERYFGMLSDACKAVDPHHMNLGIRYQGVPPWWTVKGMKQFDVFSMNCYREKVPYDTCKQIHEKLNLPVMIGEFHFGALDVGLPSPGLVHVKNQQARGDAYRYYTENAAANPYCVGVHYFTLYDQSAMGRFDGENYNIGFLDICNRPYEAMETAARKAHENLYAIAADQKKPFQNKPDYLPRLF